jgi:hypothetical protein
MADSTVQSGKAPWHIWLVGIGSLLWNSIGVMDFVMAETRNKAYMSGFTRAQTDYFYSFPSWAIATWGIAVWGGVFGSLLLLFRGRQAAYLFLASSIGTVATDLYTFVLSDGLKAMGGAGAVAFSAVIFIIGVILLVYTRAMLKRGVLR